jgi:large subunit ribosomal protein L9
MKIILLRDISGTGKKWDVKEVSSGHGRNFLITKGFAKEATAHAIAELTVRKKTDAIEREVSENLLQKNLEALGGKEIVIRMPANEKGHLFGGIHRQEIVEALRKELRTAIDPSMLEFAEPIKEVGEHTISVSADKTKTTFVLKVERDF